jgi:hypothetical protein
MLDRRQLQQLVELVEVHRLVVLQEGQEELGPLQLVIMGFQEMLQVAEEEEQERPMQETTVLVEQVEQVKLLLLGVLLYLRELVFPSLMEPASNL